MKRIAIIGGGSAGVMFANRMRREFTEDEVELTVIERSDKHYFQPAFTSIAFGLDEGEDVMRPTKDLFYEGVNLLTDSATRINPKNNTVTTSKHGEVSYDYLVVATGAKLNFDEPAGMKEGLNKGEGVFTFYTMDGALKLRDAIQNCDGGTIVSMSSENPIKCPAAPINFILMAEDTMRNLGKRNKFKFVLTTPMQSVIPNQPYLEKFNSILDSKEIGVVNNFSPGEVDYKNGVVRSYNGKKVNFDLLSIIPPHEGEQVIHNSEELGDAAGWVTCNKYHLLSNYYSNIYAIGDASDVPASKTMTSARIQAKVLTNRMKALLVGKEPTATSTPEVLCPISPKKKKSVFGHYNDDELQPLYRNLILKGLI